MDDKLKTSQQKRGEHHLPEGKDGGATSGPAPAQSAGGIQTTSGKLSLPEGD